MKARSVYVGFNPGHDNRELAREVRHLVRLLSSAGLKVYVPSAYKPTSLDRVYGIERAESLTQTLPSVCVFITPPLSVADDVLLRSLDEALCLGIERYGFIFKQQRDTGLVPQVTFDMFHDRGTEVCNAVHSHQVVARWVESKLSACAGC